MKEPVITHTDVKDRIRLDNKYDFDVLLTIGLDEHSDFYIKIVFLDLIMDTLKNAIEIEKQMSSMTIDSPFLKKEDFNITHIVITKMYSSTDGNICWECLSDDPNLTILDGF